MAEFCLECYLRICKPADLQRAVVHLSEEEELCEGCGKFKEIVENVYEPELTEDQLDEINAELLELATSFKVGLDRDLFDRAGRFQEKTAVHYLTAEWPSETEKKCTALLLKEYRQKIFLHQRRSPRSS